MPNPIPECWSFDTLLSVSESLNLVTTTECFFGPGLNLMAEIAFSSARARLTDWPGMVGVELFEMKTKIHPASLFDYTVNSCGREGNSCSMFCPGPVSAFTRE